MANIIGKTIWDKMGVNKFGKYLDLSAYRHKLIAGNVANATTPGYASKDINFDAEVKKALGDGPVLPMKTTNPGHMGGDGPHNEIKVIQHGPDTEDDLNGVDVDTEVTNLAVNQMHYTIGATILERKLSALRKAITGR